MASWITTLLIWIMFWYDSVAHIYLKDADRLCHFVWIPFQYIPTHRQMISTTDADIFNLNQALLLSLAQQDVLVYNVLANWVRIHGFE